MNSFNYYHLIVSILMVQSVFNEEIVTFQRRNNVSCLTVDVTLPIFISPPSIEENFRVEEINVLFKSKWIDDDWSLHVGDALIPGTFIDKRWQDFPILKTDYLRFKNRPSISFSVYGPNKLTLHMTSGDTSAKHQVKIQDVDRWIHCSIITQNQTVFYQQDEHNLKEWHNLKPDTVVIKSTNTTYWKKHSYQFRLSHTVTTSKPTTLNIPASKSTCLLLYTLLCQTCILKVLHLNYPSSKTFLINSTNNEVEVINSWKTNVIEIQQYKETWLQFYRNGGQSDGLWAIDVQICPTNQNNLYVYTTTLSIPEAKVCRILENLEKLQNGTKSSNINPPINKNSVTCPPGFLGLHCDISCATVLGHKFPHCEEHRFCEGTKCTCGWGHEGKLCHERCTNDKWGLSCLNKCNSSCHRCNPITGECVTKQLQPSVKDTFKHWMKNPIVDCLLLVVVLMKLYVFQRIIGPVLDRLWSRLMSTREENIDESENPLVENISSTTSL